MTTAPVAEQIRQQLLELDPSDTAYATRFTGSLLTAAQTSQASDVHLTPIGNELEIRWRLDGVLQNVGNFPSGRAADIIMRLKVLAELLTYKNDIPQEGRIRETPGNVEMRVSAFPTLHGERAVIRLFAADSEFQYLHDLGLTDDITRSLDELIMETSGAIIISGPAGSGKTTTAYACLRELVKRSQGGKSIVSLEDPIEVAIRGVAQSQVNPPAGFTLLTGLRSIMRQDPEAIMIGEMRDRETAEIAFQASLTGHLVVTTFHAGSAVEAVGRLIDMGIEPYLLRSGILAILNQRLLRQLCDCASPTTDDAAKLQLPVQQARQPEGCENCMSTGYRRRTVIAEMLSVKPDEIGRAVLDRADTKQLEELATKSGMVTRWRQACRMVDEGTTSPAEVRRVLGFGLSMTKYPNTQ